MRLRSRCGVSGLDQRAGKSVAKERIRSLSSSVRAAAAVALARWTVLLNAVLHARAYLVIMGSFDLAEFLGTIANYKCTYAFIAPPVAVALAKHPRVDSYDMSSLRGILSGAAPLDEDLGHAAAQRLGCRLVHGYG